MWFDAFQSCWMSFSWGGDAGEALEDHRVKICLASNAISEASREVSGALNTIGDPASQLFAGSSQVVCIL